jgi:hypothetical protein
MRPPFTRCTFLQGHVSHAVGPDFLLEANDLLYFSGQIKQAKHYSEQFNLDLLTNETETGEGKGFAGNRDLKYVEDGAQPPSDTAQLLQVGFQGFRVYASLVCKTILSQNYRTKAKYDQPSTRQQNKSKEQAAFLSLGKHGFVC